MLKCSHYFLCDIFVGFKSHYLPPFLWYTATLFRGHSSKYLMQSARIAFRGGSVPSLAQNLSAVIRNPDLQILDDADIKQTCRRWLIWYTMTRCFIQDVFIQIPNKFLLLYTFFKINVCYLPTYACTLQQFGWANLTFSLPQRKVGILIWRNRSTIHPEPPDV